MKIRVLKVESGKTPEIIETEDCLEAFQKEVEGYIEVVYPFEDPVAIICNEEGKIKGASLNRALRDENGEVYDVIAGAFLVTGLSDDNFSSLNDEQLEKFEIVFHDPEVFIQVGKRIISVPVKGKAEENEFKTEDLTR